MSGGAFPADDLVRPCEGFPPTPFARQLKDAGAAGNCKSATRISTNEVHVEARTCEMVLPFAIDGGLGFGCWLSCDSSVLWPR
ncbi:hypothetical protein IGI04_007491 [Brassica rapa subsp. trilocularis]|uniref:Uncharacterized protein n=1 Tax=Brassica rapa subsp. trilocularis TaxID=1813537 RepID=A0ABQ7NJY6_BRACM|nr:hypothetical protein IGI04_007491 [Brassica rapa subsp. trilocularis]